jgi:predicted outer membrane protein
MLVKVRLAGAWELPTGEQSQTKGTSQAVRDAGMHLIQGHTELNNTDEQIASKLGVPIPTQPTPEQQGFLTQLNAATGQEYDNTFAGLLRDQHGAVFQLLAQVRAGTRNSMIRNFADRCMQVVLDHITMMERTGLVNYQALPSPTAPPPNPAPTAQQVASNNNSSLGVFVIAAVLVAVAIAVPFFRRVKPKKVSSVIPE